MLGTGNTHARTGSRIFYGWWILLATSLVHFWGAGAFYYSFTAFFNPLVDEFKWSYTATSFAASFRSMESGLAAPVVGFLTDRFGPRRLIFSGAVLSGVASLLLSRINALWSFYAAYIFMSIGSSLLYPLPGWATIANWFKRRQSLTLGILVAAVGVGGILVKLVDLLITTYGWRHTCVIIAIATWVICIPLSLLVRHRPERYGYGPDGITIGSERASPKIAPKQAARPVAEQKGFGVRQAMRTRTFWMLALLATASAGVLSAVVVHVMPYLISVQVPNHIASSVAASLVLISALGRFGFGWLGDHAEKRRLLAIALFIQVIGLIVFAFTRTLPMAIVFLTLYGIGFGGVITLRLSIQGEYFGNKSFGSIMGMLQLINMLGTIICPIFAGFIYDVQRSYHLVWLVFAGLLLLAVPLALFIERPGEGEMRERTPA